MPDRYGRQSILRLTIEPVRGKTNFTSPYATPPFKIMKPFYRGALMRLMLMVASPGIMEGDSQSLIINVKEGAKGEIYSQSFEKIHKMEQGFATREININQEKNTLFIYSPLPTIPYGDSAFKSHTLVRLWDKSSRLVYSDILTAGRVARGEVFDYKLYKNLVEIYEGEALTYRDNSFFEPNEVKMSSIGMYEGCTHLLNTVICNISLDKEEIADIFKNHQYPWGLTESYHGYICIRALGMSAENLQQLSEAVYELILKKIKEE